MEIDIRQDCAGVDWKTVSETLKTVGMAPFKNDAATREAGLTD